MSRPPLGSRRTRQEGNVVAKRVARDRVYVPPFTFMGFLAAPSVSGIWPVTQDLEIFHLVMTATAPGTTGLQSIIEVKKNDEVLDTFTMAGEIRIIEYDIDTIDPYFFSGPLDFIHVGATDTANHPNLMVQIWAYDNVGR